MCRLTQITRFENDIHVHLCLKCNNIILKIHKLSQQHIAGVRGMRVKIGPEFGWSARETHSLFKHFSLSQMSGVKM